MSELSINNAFSLALNRLIGHLEVMAQQSYNADHVMRETKAALAAYLESWTSDHFFVPDLSSPISSASTAKNSDGGMRQLRALALDNTPSLDFRQLHCVSEKACWGAVIRPESRQFVSGICFWPIEKPSAEHLTNLSKLLRLCLVLLQNSSDESERSEEKQLKTHIEEQRLGSMVQLVASVSHQMNTPLGILNTAASSIDRLVKEVGPLMQSDPNVNDLLGDLMSNVWLMSRNSKKLCTLIDRFRRVAVHSPDSSLQEVEFFSAVSDIVALFDARSLDVNVSLIDETDPSCATWRGNIGHLTQVLLNLLNNTEAHAFTDGSGHVNVIVASSLAADRPTFSIAVEDSGQGIEISPKSRVFDPFVARQGSPGIGLGLTVVHTIVTSVFNGEVLCESRPGSGSVFHVIFSHCNDGVSEKRDTRQSPREKVEKFAKYQQRLADGDRLSVDEQLDLSRLRTHFDTLMKGSFAGHRSRAYPRIPLCKKVRLLEPPPEEEIELRDVSLTGAMLLLQRELELGSPLLINCDTRAPIILAGLVTSRVQVQHPDTLDVSYQCGVRFETEDPISIRHLKVFLARLLAERISAFV